MCPALANPSPTSGAALLEPAPIGRSPRVVALFVAPRKGAAMRQLEEVRALAGLGLEGDRYFAAQRSPAGGATRASAVTLIEVEALEALQGEHGIRLAPAESRRNLLTRGVALNELVGHEFRVGEVVLRGIGLCQPCLHLQHATRAGVLRGLVHRGGLRAEIVSGGVIRSGDPLLADC